MEKQGIEHIEELIHNLKEECRKETRSSDEEVKTLLETTSEVLEGLEKVFHLYAAQNHGHVYSSKSNEPWD
jgi:hypothetical protein